MDTDARSSVQTLQIKVVRVRCRIATARSFLRQSAIEPNDAAVRETGTAGQGSAYGMHKLRGCYATIAISRT